MSRTWPLVVVDTVVPSIILGLLPITSLLNLLKRCNCAVAISSHYLLYKEIKYSSTEKKKETRRKKRASFFLKQTVK
ncbi:hypothetical protein Peur_057849 [Populus x canadensis]